MASEQEQWDIKAERHESLVTAAMAGGVVVASIASVCLLEKVGYNPGIDVENLAYLPRDFGLGFNAKSLFTATEVVAGMVLGWKGADALDLWLIQNRREKNS